MGKYKEMTTKMVGEMRRLTLEGKNDRTVAEILGVSDSTVQKYRTMMGLPPVRERSFGFMIYTVWDAKTEELVVCGTAKECAKFMGYKVVDSFHSMVSRVTHGKQNNYYVVKEFVGHAET